MKYFNIRLVKCRFSPEGLMRCSMVGSDSGAFTRQGRWMGLNRSVTDELNPDEGDPLRLPELFVWSRPKRADTPAPQFPHSASLSPLSLYPPLSFTHSLFIRSFMLRIISSALFSIPKLPFISTCLKRHQC